MITVPIKGVRSRRSGSRCDTQTVADWIELSSIAFGERSTLNEAVDSFIEAQVYIDPDKAYEDISDAWNEFSVRMKIAGESYPFRVDSGGIEPLGEWGDYIPYVFQLLVSCLPWLRSEYSQFKQDSYNQQGHLFEVLSSLAIGAYGLSVHRPGWPPEEESGVEPLVSRVASFVNEAARLEELGVWFSESAKDEKLDLVASYPIRDSRPAVPVLMIQVASGANWQEKVLSPHIDTWREVIGFTVTPIKGFCIPFTLSDSEFRLWCKKAGVMFEGLRLSGLVSMQSSLALSDWCSAASNWMKPFVSEVSQL